MSEVMDITEITETFEFLDDWEDKYRLVIDLGKSLPEMPDQQRSEEHLVRGCQSQVWLHVEMVNGRLSLSMDSDAHIVRGLIYIILAAMNDKSPEEVLAVDMQSLFSQLQLLEHLSATRGNGLVAMIARIRDMAEKFRT